MDTGQYIAELTGALTLDKFGQWFHEGKAFTNQKLSDLFSRSIKWDPETKRFLICIGVHRASFTFEDTVYFTIGLEEKGPKWTLTFSDGSLEDFDPSRLSRGQEHQFYYLRKDGHLARCSRAVHQILLRHAVSNEELEFQSVRFEVPYQNSRETTR